MGVRSTKTKQPKILEKVFTVAPLLTSHRSAAVFSLRILLTRMDVLVERADLGYVEFWT